MAVSKRTKFHRNLMKSGSWKDFDYQRDDVGGMWAYDSDGQTVVPIRKFPKREPIENKRKYQS